MSKINPKAMKAVFTDDVLNKLPKNNELKVGVGRVAVSETMKIRAKQRTDDYYQSHQEAMKKRSDSEWKQNQAASQVERGLTHRGHKNGKYTGATIATNIDTGEVTRYEGRRALEAAGYASSSVSEAIKRKRLHKRCMWTKEGQ